MINKNVNWILLTELPNQLITDDFNTKEKTNKSDFLVNWKPVSTRCLKMYTRRCKVLKHKHNYMICNTLFFLYTHVTKWNLNIALHAAVIKLLTRHNIYTYAILPSFFLLSLNDRTRRNSTYKIWLKVYFFNEIYKNNRIIYCLSVKYS